MRKSALLPTEQGPFRADQLRSGDPYELSHGHAILCMPTGGRGASAAMAGAKALSTDPAVEKIVVRLAKSVPVEALYDLEVSGEVAFRNLLEQHGYKSLDAVRAEGEAVALRQAILTVFAARRLAMPEPVRTAISGCSDRAVLGRWVELAVTVDSPSDLLSLSS